jgi:tyrosine-protein kinase Etk/Wzc
MDHDGSGSKEPQSRTLVRSQAGELALAPPGAPGTGPGPDAGHDLGELLLAVRRSVPLVCLCVAVVGALTLAVTALSRMQFRARGSLYLGEVQSKSPSGTGLPDQLDFVGGRNAEVSTELEILQSRDLITGAVLRAGLNTELAPEGWSRPRYWRWLVDGRDARRVDPPTTLVAVEASLAESVMRAATFEVTVGERGTYVVSAGGQPLGTGALGRELVTPLVTLTLAADPNEVPTPGSRYRLRVAPVEDVLEGLKKTLIISVPRGAAGSTDAVRIANIELVHPSPRAAAAFVTQLMSRYLERRQNWRTEEATAAESFITDQVRSVREALDEAERKLADYKKNSQVVVLGNETTTMIEQTGQYEQQRLTAQLLLNTFTQVADALDQPNAPLEHFLVGDASDPVLATLATNLANAEQELQRARERFTDDAPAVRELKTQVETQLQTIKTYVGGRRARAQQQLTSLNKLIARFEDKMKTVPGAELDLARLTRNADVLGKMYTFLLERQQQAAVAKGSTMSRNHVLDTPRIPRRADSPSLFLRALLGGALGLFLGIALALVKRGFGNTFESERDLRARLGAIPLLGLVPKRRKAKRPDDDEALAAVFDVVAPVADPSFGEAFRHLRATLYRFARANGHKVFLVTSPSPGDGKTLCTLSLAAALAADGKRILVVEGDLRRPSHHLLYAQPAGPGLGDMADRDEIVRTVVTTGGSFDAITAGAALRNPAEFLSSRAFGQLISHARAEYDYVLIDSPPFPLVSDALIIATFADCILTVVRMQSTRRRVADEHFRRFFMSSPAVAHGVILNAVDRLSSHQYGYSAAYGPRPAIPPGLAVTVEMRAPEKRGQAG